MLLLLAIPVWLETDALLYLWLGQVPDYAALFVRLALLCTLIDMSSNALLQLIQATGKVKNYYLITASVSLLVFPLSWLLFRLGYPPEVSYWVFAAIYGLVFVLKIGIAHRLCAFPVGAYLSLLIRLALVAVVAFFLAQWAGTFCEETLWRILVVTLTGTLVTTLLAFALALSSGERAYLLQKMRRK